MAKCVCIRCLGTSRPLMADGSDASVPSRCPLCHDAGVLEDVDPYCAALITRLYTVWMCDDTPDLDRMLAEIVAEHPHLAPRGGAS